MFSTSCPVGVMGGLRREPPDVADATPRLLSPPPPSPLLPNLSRFHHQALVELKILEALRRKDKDNTYNVVHMKDFFYFRNHLCITFELLGSAASSL